MNESLPSSCSRRSHTLVQFWATLVAMLWWGGIGVAHAGTTSLLVASGFSDSVPRYDAITGAFLGDFVPAGSGGLDQPRGLAIGPDGNLYVAADGTADAVLRYDGGTGAFIDAFVTGLDPFGIVFGPDGHLYAADFTTAEVLRYDGTTGGLIDTFVSDPSRLGLPRDLLFGPDGNLYVSSAAFRQVVRYNGTTGAFIDVFASGVDARGLVFGPDGNLYVASFGDDAVLRFNGTTGVFIDQFVTVGSGGLDGPVGVLFGPDGNLYVASFLSDEVKRYDGTTGAFIDTFVTVGSGGLDAPRLMLFTNGAADLLDMVCELKVDKEGVEKSLHFETFNTDPDLQAKWDALFGVTPGTSVDAMLTLQAERTVTWEAGVLEMGGTMKLKIKADKHNPALKKVKIKKAGKKDGPTLYISGTGALNANLAHGGWHEVKVKNMDNVTVTLGGDTMTGFVKKLEVKLAADSTTGAPILKHFKLEIEGMTSAVDVNKGTVSSVVVEVPATVMTALAGVEYAEKIKDKPLVLGGHTGAESKLDNGVGVLADLSTLVDGNNDQLKERKGACDIGAFEFRAEIVSVPTLITPINNVAITQNDPNIGCPPHPTRGFGSRIFFDWTDSSSPNGIAGYHIFAKHQNAQFPIVDTFVTASEFTTTRCNSFVIDANLEGWGWDVQARDNFGNLSPKSETGTFKFEPCRLDDGTPCFAPG